MTGDTGDTGGTMRSERGLTTREAMDCINLGDEDFHARYGSAHRESDGVWCCQAHEDQHGDESGW